ncbi:MAG: ATP-binding cassette domain-containing protein, partial [Firmicutes bacterium]|nr:ATP-binding cassette domain-containing protein [Bacillota bacterium]
IEDVLATESDIKGPEPQTVELGGATETGQAAAPEHAGTQASPEHLAGSIEVSHLTFRYPGTDTDVLKDVSFRVERGQMLGIVGRTGAGKTTLVDLMMRAFDSEPGAIKIGGKNIQDVSLETLRSTIGYVPQDDFLFSASVSDNIRFGDRSKTQEEIEEAARLACVHDNITDFKDGYDTMVGERGVSLSGGQKQRIAIARALILDPEILILDDSLSAVDTDTEAQIKRNLAGKRAGRTNVLIAHRLSTLQDADLIIVIEDGRITESGTHDELLSRGGFYAELWQRQLMEKMRKEELGL